MKKAKPFITEAALCAAFVRALPAGWTAYAETGGWDLLLSRRADGFQIGIQAKLRLNPAVLAQCLHAEYRYSNSPSPDCVAALVPWGEVALGMPLICAHLGITVIRMEPPRGHYRPVGHRAFEPELPELGDRWSEQDWYERAPPSRSELPEYVPDVPAGVKHPRQLTPWKIGALKIAVLLELNGHVTRADFRTAGIDHRRWVAQWPGWLRAVDGRLVAGPALPDFKRQHPEVFEQVKADLAKWRKQEEATLL